MNKRILELADKDGADIWEDQASACRHFIIEKFAELIVRECADRCEMSPYPHPNYSVAIKKHFGVEE